MITEIETVGTLDSVPFTIVPMDTPKGNDSAEMHDRYVSSLVAKAASVAVQYYTRAHRGYVHDDIGKQFWDALTYAKFHFATFDKNVIETKLNEADSLMRARGAIADDGTTAARAYLNFSVLVSLIVEFTGCERETIAKNLPVAIARRMFTKLVSVSNDDLEFSIRDEQGILFRSAARIVANNGHVCEFSDGISATLEVYFPKKKNVEPDLDERKIRARKAVQNAIGKAVETGLTPDAILKALADQFNASKVSASSVLSIDVDKPNHDTIRAMIMKFHQNGDEKTLYMIQELVDQAIADIGLAQLQVERNEVSRQRSKKK